MRIRQNQFNTEIFNMKMGDIEDLEGEVTQEDVQSMIECARIQDYQHLNVKIPIREKDKTNLFLRNGFYLVDTQLMFLLKSKNVYVGGGTASTVSYREFCENDKEWIMNIAQNAYILDQYHSDRALEKSLCDQYYARWAKNCCEGFSDKTMVIALPDNRVIGYITFDYKNGNAIVGLAAIEEAYRGKGLFSLMIEETLRMQKMNNIKKMYYGTQLSNIPVLKIMGRYGGTIEYSNHVMHFML